jgi:beta-barrel assembly-enhancing protease
MYVCIDYTIIIFRMKNPRLLSILLFSALVLLTQTSQSQTVDFNNYTLLKSSGQIPEVVIKALSLKNENEIISGIGAGDKKTVKQKKDFLMKNDWEIFQLVRDGNVLFNDPIGNYITKVAKELLKDDPELFGELHFFAIKYPEVNAFSNNSGFVFVDIGLIAKLETESELAFILAHEISHCIKKHPMEAHLENLKIFKGKSAYRFKSYGNNMDLVGKRSREIELESDSIGISLYLASDYNVAAIDKTLDLLHYSYLPFSDEPFDKRFFDDGEFVVPDCFFLDTCARRSAIKDTYDENYSHPNIYKRKSHIDSILAGKTSKDGKDFLVSESEFNNIREIARFELVHFNVRNEEYGDAIYNAYALLKKYPGNKYLELCIAKALYGLTKYKNEEKYFYVAEPYEKAEEQSQQVHFFLRQLNRKQLNVLSVKYIQKLIKKYPSADFLDKLETDLINDMIIRNKVDFEKFKDTVRTINYATLNPALPRKELQKKTEDFYLFAFKDEARNDTEFIRKCSEATEAKDIADKRTQLSAKEKSDLEDERMKSIRLTGIKAHFDTLIILDPYLELDRKNIEDEYSKYDNNKKQLDNKVSESAANDGLKPEMISSRDIYVNNDISKYNQLCEYREMLREIMSHDIGFFYPVGAELFSDENKKSQNILCYIGLFDNSSEEQYYISFTDLNSGEALFWNEQKIQKGNFDKLKKYLTEDFKVLTKQ